MPKKLFVGGLSWGISQDDLCSKFEQFGNVVEAKLITDRESGRSRGFGFVTFEDAESAENAINDMNNQEWEGRTIKVSEAQDKNSGGGNRGPRSPRW